MNIYFKERYGQSKSNIFYPEVILKHSCFSSGQAAEKDCILYARAALFYKYNGFLAYFKLLKHLIMLVNRGQLNILLLGKKYKVGLKGIFKFKKLTLKRR